MMAYNADRAIEETARTFHIGDKPPKVSQMIYANPDISLKQSKISNCESLRAPRGNL